MKYLSELRASSVFLVGGIAVWASGMAWAQTVEDSVVPLLPEWQLVVGGYGLEKASAGMILDDGRIIIAGEMTADEDARNSDGLVLMVAPDGKVLKRLRFGNEGHDATHGVVAVGGNPENGFFVVGDRTISGADETADKDRDVLWMMRLDSDGRLLWERNLPDEEGIYDRYLFNMSQAADGSFYAVGKARERANPLHSRGFVIHFDADGNIKWQRKYGQGRQNVLHNLLLLSDGGLLGMGGTDDTPDKNLAAWVIRLDPSGQPVWQKRLGQRLFQQFRSAVVAPDEEDEFILSGDSLSIDGAKQVGWMVRMDDGGRVVAEQSFQSDYMEYCYDIKRIGQGRYVVLCDLDHVRDDQTDAAMLRLFDADDRLLKSWIVSGAGNDTAFRLFRSPGGDLIVLGTTTSRPAIGHEGDLTEPLSRSADDNDIWVFRLAGTLFRD